MTTLKTRGIGPKSDSALTDITYALTAGERTLKDIAEYTGRSLSLVYKVVKAAIESGHVKALKEMRQGAKGRPATVYANTAKGNKLAAKRK